MSRNVPSGKISFLFYFCKSDIPNVVFDKIDIKKAKLFIIIL